MVTSIVSESVLIESDLLLLDYCGTLYDCNTTMCFLEYLCAERVISAAKERRYHAVASLLRKIGIIDNSGYVRLRLRPLAGIEETAIDEQIGLYHSRVLAKCRKPDTFELLKLAQSVGKEVGIVSFTIDRITLPDVKAYGIKHLIANTLEFVGRKCTGRFAYMGQDEGKLAATVRIYGRERLKTALYVTDNEDADRDLIGAVGHAVVI